MADETQEEILRALEEENKRLKAEQPKRKQALTELRGKRDELKNREEKLTKAREAERGENRKLKLNDEKIKSLISDIELRVKKLKQAEKTESTPTDVTSQQKIDEQNPDMGVAPPPPPPLPAPKVDLLKQIQGGKALNKVEEAPKPKDDLLKQIQGGKALKKAEQPEQPKKSTGVDMMAALQGAFANKMGLGGSKQQAQETEEKPKSLEQRIKLEQDKNDMYKKEQKTIEDLEEQITKLSKPPIDFSLSSSEKYALPNEYVIAHSTEAVAVYKADQETLITSLESSLQELEKLEKQRSEAVAQKKQAEVNLKIEQKEIFEDEVPKQGEMQGPPVPPPPPNMPPPPPPNVSPKAKRGGDAPPKTEPTLQKAEDTQPKPIFSFEEIKKRANQPVSEKEGIIKILRNPENEHYKNIMKALGEKSDDLVNQIKATIDDMLKNDPKLKDDLPYCQDWGMRKKYASQHGKRIVLKAKELNDPRVVAVITKFYDDLSEKEKITLIDAYKKTLPKQETVAPSQKEGVTVVVKTEKKEPKKTPGGLLEKQETSDLLKKVAGELQTAKEKVEVEQKEAKDLTLQADEHLKHLEELGPKVIPREKPVSEKVEKPVVVLTGADKPVEEKKEETLKTDKKPEEKIAETTMSKTRERAPTITSPLPDPEQPYVPENDEIEELTDYGKTDKRNDLPIHFEKKEEAKVTPTTEEKTSEKIEKPVKKEKLAETETPKTMVTFMPEVEQKLKQEQLEQAEKVYNLIANQYKESRKNFIKLFFPRKETRKVQLEKLRIDIKSIYNDDNITDKKAELKKIFDALKESIGEEKNKAKSDLVKALDIVIDKIPHLEGTIKEKQDTTLKKK